MRSPRWIWSTLLAGSLLLAPWGIFVLGFTSEPSAVGRTGMALIVIGGGSIGTAIVGVVAAVGMFRRTPWAGPAAWFASVLMILTCVSSWAGVIGLIGLVSSRISPKT